MPPQPPPTPAMEPRQYVTVSSAMIVTASVDPNASYLPVDGQAQSSQGSVEYGTVTFEGVGGTLTADKLTTTSTTTDDGPAPTSANAGTDATDAPKSQSIPLGAVVAVAVVASALCLLLLFCCWWKRRKTKQEKEFERAHQPMHQEMSTTFVGGHGYGKETPEGSWEKFSQPTSASLHVPGNLPSPTSSKLFVSESQTHLINKLSVSTSSPSYYTADSSNRGPPVPRRHSVKSTVTGKVNPSNNFANDDDDDYYDEFGSDAKSHRSRRNPLSPPSGLATFQGLSALGPPPKMPGEPNSFLTFRSGELPPTAPSQGSNIRESPTPMQTPKPKRVPTQKSHKGGGASQHGHAGYFDQHLPLPANDSAYGGVEMTDRRNTKDLVMDNLLAALDTPSAPEHPSRSGDSPRSHNYDDTYDPAASPVDPSAARAISSPSSPYNGNTVRK